jgi:DNA-binding LytR/AlgR family response regulator
VDFSFLDINMPHLTGMDLVGLLPPATQIVFTPAYSEHAAESYSFNTLDYMLKPVTLKRFYTAVQKIESHFGRKDAFPAAPQSPVEDYFFIKSGKSFHKVLLRDIMYFEGEKEYVRLVTTAEQLLVYRRMKEIEEQLAIPFIRIHHSYIVNIAQLDKVQDNHVFIADKQIPISEKFREAFMQAIKQRIF